MATEQQGVIFDFGGVLCRVNPEWVAELDREYGTSMSVWAPMLAGSAGVETTMGGKPFSTEDMAPVMAERLRAQLGDRSLEAAKRMCLLFTSLEAMPFFQPMVDILRELHDAGLRVGILSNAPSDAEATAFRPLMESGAVDALGISGRDGIGKPAPQAFQAMLTALGVEARNTWFIDDAPGHVEAGRALGLNAVLFDGDVDKFRIALRASGLTW